MPARDGDHTSDHLDLTALLWGEAPSWPSPSSASLSKPGAPSPPPPLSGVESAVDAASSAEDAPPGAFTPSGDDGVWTVPQAWEGIRDEPVGYETKPVDAEDDGLDTAALDALGALTLDAFTFDDPDEDDDPGLPALSGEKELGVGALTDRLEREVMPRLRRYLREPGYLSLGHLAHAVSALQGSEPHLERVRAFIEQTTVPIVPARSHKSARNLSIAAIEEAQRRFGDLLRGAPDEDRVVERLGYGQMRLTAGTRAFLMQAWMGHYLSRVEERRHAETVEAEIGQVGTDIGRWSPSALVAREALILDNLWLVARVARGYVGRGVEIDDLHQMGSLGLFRAVEKFDASLNFRFVTYASNWVYQSIHRGVADQGRPIRLPVYVHERGKLVGETEDALWNELGSQPSLEQVAEACDVPLAVVRGLLVTGRTVSLDDPVHGVEAASRLRSPTDAVEAVAEDAERASVIRSVLEGLSAREARVLELRFGLIDGRKLTLEEVAHRSDFGVTRERIRQIEDKALRKLRHPSRSTKLRVYTNLPEKQRLPSVSSAAISAIILRFKRHDQAMIKALFGLNGLVMPAKEVADSFGAPPWYVRNLERQAVLMAHGFTQRYLSATPRPAPERRPSTMIGRGLAPLRSSQPHDRDRVVAGGGAWDRFEQPGSSTVEPASPPMLSDLLDAAQAGAQERPSAPA